jgi:hypothetical protein
VANECDDFEFAKQLLLQQATVNSINSVNADKGNLGTNGISPSFEEEFWRMDEKSRRILMLKSLKTYSDTSGVSGPSAFE